MRDVSLTGLYWSSTAYPNVRNAFYLHFDNAYDYPSSDDARWRGMSLSCLAH